MTNQTIEEAVQEFEEKFGSADYGINKFRQFDTDGIFLQDGTDWLRQALQAQREAGDRETTAQAELEMLKRVVEKVRELDKYDYIPVQVKEENPSAWAMYSEGRNKIFKDILASLEIINPK